MAKVAPLTERLRALAVTGHPRAAEMIAAAQAVDDAGPAGAAGLFTDRRRPFDPASYMTAWNAALALWEDVSTEKDKSTMGMTESTSDQRTANNTMRHQYRELTDEEKMLVDAIKGTGELFLSTLKDCPQGREISLARTKIEEAVFWAVKGITA